MGFYFAWVDHLDEMFDPDAHARRDEVIYRLEMTQTEGAFARAVVEIRRPQAGLLAPSRKRYALIARDDASGDGVDLLFRGRVTGFPVALDAHLAQIELIAAPEDWQAQLTDFHKAHRQVPWWDDLFVAPSRRDDPQQGLAARAQSYHLHRSSHEWSHVPLLAETSDRVIADNQLGADLAVRITGRPLSRIAVTLQADWLQQARGRLDLRWHMLRAFGGSLSSYTPQALRRSLPREGQAITAQSGWQVLAASFVPNGQEVTELTRIGQDPIFANDRLETLRATATRFSLPYEEGLVLRYDYRQARREVVSFSLQQAHQALYGAEDARASLYLRLEDVGEDQTPLWQAGQDYQPEEICRYGDANYKALQAHHSGDFTEDRAAGFWERTHTGAAPIGRRDRAGFFETERGRVALDHALLRARAQLVASARAIEIRFSLPWGTELNLLSLEEGITLMDPRLPGGQALGRVVAYRFHAEGETGQALCEITLACAVGQGGAPPALPEGMPDYAEADYTGADYQHFSGQAHEVATGLAYEIQADPLYEPVRAGFLHRAPYALRELRVENSFASQKQGLGTAFYAAPNLLAQTAVEQYLRAHPTGFVLRLRDLAAQDRITRQIMLLPQIWTAPRNINLEAEE